MYFPSQIQQTCVGMYANATNRLRLQNKINKPCMFVIYQRKLSAYLQIRFDPDPSTVLKNPENQFSM